MECAAGHCRQRDSAEGPERPELFGPAQLGHAARWHAAAAGGTQLSARTIDVHDEQSIRRLSARHPVQRSIQPRQPPHQSRMHQGGESARVSRSADAATDRCNQSRYRDGQDHPKQSANAHADIRGVRDCVRGCRDRKSTRLNSSHRCISYAVFCLKKKNKQITTLQHKYHFIRLLPLLPSHLLSEVNERTSYLMIQQLSKHYYITISCLTTQPSTTH